MTQVPAPRPNLAAGGQVAAIIPQSLEDAYRLSTALAASGMAPRGMDKPEQILVAIMAGAELGLAPFQSLQSFAVVNGRPTLWGDGLLAVVRGRGVSVKEWPEGEGDAMVAHCRATRPDTGEEVERTFSVADAKKAGLWGKQGPWQQYPKRMLQMRARALALRDGCADMLRGIQVREEVDDYQVVRDVTPAKPEGLKERLEAAREAGRSREGFTTHHGPEAASDEPEADLDAVLDGDDIPDHDATTGEVIDAEVEDIAQADPPSDFPGDRQAFTVHDWADRLADDLPLYETVEDVRAAWDLRKDELKAAAPDRFKALNMAVVRRAEALGKEAAQ